MRVLVTIDLKGADFVAFEAYEATVLPLLAKYGAVLELRVRACDGASETHLLRFPNAEARARFLADPARLAAQPVWERSRAQATVVEVVPVNG